MRISDILSADLIIPDLHATTRDQVLEEIVGRVAEKRGDIDRSTALRVLIDRERVGSTGVGSGLAFPHARLSALPRVVGCLARSAEGVDFKSGDHQPTHLFVALLAPETGGLHLKALACVSRLFKDTAFRERLLAGKSAPEIWETVLAEEQRLTQCE